MTTGAERLIKETASSHKAHTLQFLLMPFLCWFLCLSIADALSPESQTNFTQYGYKVDKLFPNFDPKVNKSGWVKLRHAWAPFVSLIGKYSIEHIDKYSLLQYLVRTTVYSDEFFKRAANCQTFIFPSFLQILAPAKLPKLAVKCAPHPNTGIFASFRTTQPVGQQCLDIVYYTLSATLNNNYVSLQNFAERVTMYHYNTTVNFGINITFVKFGLSGWCLVSDKSPCNKLNEFFLIINSHQHNLFYCMSRSQWSAYLDNVFTILYKPCRVICHGRTTTVTFHHQILDNARTTEDTFYEVRNIHRKYVLFSTTTISRIKYKPITVFHTFLTVQRYESIEIAFHHETHIFVYNQQNIHYMQKQARRTVFHINFFHCFFSHLHHLNKSTASINYTSQQVKHKSVKIDRTVNFTLGGSVGTPQNKFYHKVIKITADEDQTLVKSHFFTFINLDSIHAFMVLSHSLMGWGLSKPIKFATNTPTLSKWAKHTQQLQM